MFKRILALAALTSIATSTTFGLTYLGSGDGNPHSGNEPSPAFLSFFDPDLTLGDLSKWETEIALNNVWFNGNINGIKGGLLMWTGGTPEPTYIALKAGNFFHVYEWMAGGMNMFNFYSDNGGGAVPHNGNDVNGISNVSLFWKPTPIPESGATLALIGLGLAAIVSLRRFIRR